MRLLRIALALVVMVAAACNKDGAAGREDAAAQAGNGQVTEFAAAESPSQPFQPPADGLLRAPQVKKFLLAHEALAKVNEMYLDRLAGANAEGRRAILAALDLARDKAARKFGLAGYEEYRWILEDAPRHPENVRLLKQAGVTVVGG